MITPKKTDSPQLVAELGLFSAADALQWASGSALTGRVSFDRETARITLLFEKGDLIYAASRDQRAAFGRHLFSERLVDEVDLAAATVYGRDHQSPIGAVLIELGILDEKTVKPELHMHTLNLATIPLGWREGWVSAERTESEVMPVVMPKPLDMTFLLLEAARRIDETRVIRKLLPDDDIGIEVGDGEIPADASPRFQRILETLGPGSTLGQLFGQIGGSSFLFLDAVYELVELGTLRLTETPEGAAATRQSQPG